MSISQNFPATWPSLTLDFANSKTLDPRITFTRASTGTYVGTDGLVKTAAVDEARFDHDSSTGESLGLLIEESRTNLVTYSENFNFWGTAYRTTISPNAAISPSGQLNAAKFNVTTDTGYHARSLTIAGGTYTVSIFAKAGEYNGIQITGTNQTEDHACFNLANGTAYHQGSNVTNIKIENFGNGWYRCSARLPLTNGNLFVAITDGISTSWLPSFAGSSTSDGIYIWGAQIEAGSFPTSYIPTSGSTVTRSADIAQITGTNLSSWYNQSEGSVLSTHQILGLNTGSKYQNVYTLDNQTSTFRIWLYARGGGNDIQWIGGNGSTQFSIGTNLSSPKTFYRAGGVYKENDFALAVNGNLYGYDTSGAPPTVTHFGIGNRNDSSLQLNGHIKQLIYYPERLTNSQLQNLTK